MSINLYYFNLRFNRDIENRNAEQVWKIDVFNQIVIKVLSDNGAVHIYTHLISIGYLTFIVP